MMHILLCVRFEHLQSSLLSQMDFKKTPDAATPWNTSYWLHNTSPLNAFKMHVCHLDKRRKKQMWTCETVMLPLNYMQWSSCEVTVCLRAWVSKQEALVWNGITVEAGNGSETCRNELWQSESCGQTFLSLELKVKSSELLNIAVYTRQGKVLWAWWIPPLMLAQIINPSPLLLLFGRKYWRSLWRETKQ